MFVVLPRLDAPQYLELAVGELRGALDPIGTSIPLAAREASHHRDGILVCVCCAACLREDLFRRGLCLLHDGLGTLLSLTEHISGIVKVVDGGCVPHLLIGGVACPSVVPSTIAVLRGCPPPPE